MMIDSCRSIRILETTIAQIANKIIVCTHSSSVSFDDDGTKTLFRKDLVIYSCTFANLHHRQVLYPQHSVTSLGLFNSLLEYNSQTGARNTNSYEG